MFKLSRLKQTITQFECLISPKPSICKDLRDAVDQENAIIAEIWKNKGGVNRNLPLTLDANISPLFEHQLNNPIFDRYLMRLSEASIYTRSGLLQISRGCFSPEHAHGFLAHIERQRDYYSWIERKQLSRNLNDGVFYSLIAYCPGAHYHWMTDILQKLYEVLPLLPQEVKFIVPHNFTSVFADSLKALEISSGKIVLAKKREKLKVEKLFWSPPATHSGTDMLEALQWVSDRIIRWAHNKEKLHRFKNCQRLYITRKDSTKRRILNEKKLCSYLVEEGFIILALSKLSLAEQVAIFRSANVIIAPHGAGLVNLMFAQSGTYVLELFGSDVPRGGVCYWSISCCNNLSYWYITGQSDNPESEDSDFIVDVSKVQYWLKNI
jgi:hypothetical protein